MIYIRNYTPMTVWENPKIKTTFYDYTAKSPKRMMNASYFSDLPNDFLVISLAKCLFFTITESNGSTLGKDKDVSNNNYHYHISILNTSIITKVIINYDTVEVSRTWLVMETWPPMYVLIMITFIDKYMTKSCKKTVLTFGWIFFEYRGNKFL